MANKFTKSVLERQAKELKAHPAAAEAPEPAVTISAPAETPPVAEAAEPPAPLPEQPKPAAKRSAPAKQLPDLAAYIVRDEGRTAKNKTFYLDASVIDAIHRAATAQRVTDSKLVNDILKKILGV